MPAYIPPPLNHRVRVRNPSERPPVIRDSYGAIMSDQEWGSMAWAARKDLTPRTVIEETQEVKQARVRFTIRFRAIAPNVEVVHDGEVFESVGPATNRGGPGAGRASRYLEIVCERRA